MHILNGDSAAGSFRQAFQLPTEAVLIFRDVLSCGWLGAFETMPDWSSTRKGYWTELFSEYGFGSTEDIEKAPRDFYTNAHELRHANEVNLWIGCSLSDHLLLVFIVVLFKHYELDLKNLKIHQYEKFTNKNLTVIGLGALSPSQIGELSPEPIILNDAQIAFCS